jgi:hypothetical protein
VGTVIHLLYEPRQYPEVEECLSGIRDHVDRGWQVSEIRGSGKGPYFVLFRREEPDERLRPAR